MDTIGRFGIPIELVQAIENNDNDKKPESLCCHHFGFLIRLQK